MQEKIIEMTDLNANMSIITLDVNDLNISIKRQNLALAGVAQCIEHRPANQRVASSIPSQGTCLGCRPGPW